MSDPRYPVGKFVSIEALNPDERRERIDEIAAAPVLLREAVGGLSETQLDTPYRDGGWTVRQVAHHIPDSHMNGYVRLKLALTEEAPVIRPYEEAEWAKLADVSIVPIEVSLALLEALHVRFVTLLRAMRDDDFRRTLKHPAYDGMQTLDWLVALYAWHGRHHVGHITSLRERMGW